MVITKDDIKQTVIKLHQCGKHCPNEYVRISKCRTQEEINATFTNMVMQITDSMWDWFSYNTLPSKDIWERATYKAMGLKGDITAELMINAIKECRIEDAGKVGDTNIRDCEETKYSPFSTEDRLCNKMLWTFTRKMLSLNERFCDYVIPDSEVKKEMALLGINKDESGLKRRVVIAGLIEKNVNKKNGKTETIIDIDGEQKVICLRTLSSLNGLPILFSCMPDQLIDSLGDAERGEIWLKLR